MPAYQTSIYKALDWCPDLSTGDNVEYKAGFTDCNEEICWGMVKKGTNTRHGFVLHISSFGWIEEHHYKNDILHGYFRSIYDDGKYRVGYYKDGSLEFVIIYDASNKEIRRA